MKIAEVSVEICYVRHRITKSLVDVYFSVSSFFHKTRASEGSSEVSSYVTKQL